ncbi:MAG TPA: methionine adenosyltransferase [Longimicrobiales bacterium]|nr:methionine adenosyltransferase [Longimicrobiales bacterium]
MATEFLLTSESVGEGHPDKVADRISDAVLDAYLAQDAEARVACETLVTQNFVCVAGEVRSTANVSPEQIERIARNAIADIGYVENDGRFAAEHVRIDVQLHRQSGEIASAVDKAEKRKQGAGDQGMMFGYATNETPVLMPAPITWAHSLTRILAAYRKNNKVDWLRPDSKSQVSVRYIDGRPVEITRIVVSTQHKAEASAATIRELIIEELIPEAITGAVLGTNWRDYVLVNPSGSFVEGGPATDTGLTGRKIIVDTYGGAARHGGGAFSGKDPSKVDRSAAYATRWAAKNVVAAGLAERCEICIAYAIGVAEPVAIGVDTFGTGDERAISEWIRNNFDLTPIGIIEGLNLTRPIYTPTSAYGHFGRTDEGDGLFPWENVVPASARIEIPA